MVHDGNDTVGRKDEFLGACFVRILDAGVLPKGWAALDTTPAVLVAGAVSDTNVARIARTSVVAVALGYAPIVAGRWTMVGLITQARAVRATWEAVRGR